MRFLEALLSHLLPHPYTSEWFGLASVFIATVQNFLLSCMVIYALVLLRRVRRTLAALPQSDRATKRMPLVKRTVVRFGWVYLAWWFVFASASYWSDAMSRNDAKDCERITSPGYKDYYVEECSVRGGRVGYRNLVRLYATGNNELLAEEFVSNAEGLLEWKKTRANAQWIEVPSKPYIVQRGWLDDGEGTYGVSIELPPPWWQRMRAQLP